MINNVLMLIMSVGIVLGGLDRILGNRFGLGEQFEKGFMLLGPMALSMTGIICLAPALAGVLGKIITPVYNALGVDPAMFGSILALDMGGYQLAAELANDALVGRYAGIVAASIFGCTMVFTIPVGMGMIDKDARGAFARGMMLGLAAMPLGLVLGGLVCGLGLKASLWQNMPIFVMSFFLALGLWKIPERMVKGFCIAAEGIKILVTAGLILAAVESLTGWNPVPGMTPISEALAVVASIGVVQLGSFPIAELLRRALSRPFGALGRKIGLSPRSLTGMLVGLASSVPVLSDFGSFDRRGQIAVAAFLVSGSAVLASHMGFTVSTEPDLLPPLIAAKLSGAFAAAVLAVLATRKEMKNHA